MPTLALLYKPAAPNTTSPFPALRETLSLKYKSQPPQPYSLSFHSFVSTSSLLPTSSSSSEASSQPPQDKSRPAPAQTCILNAPHLSRQHAFVSTTMSTPPDGLPNSSKAGKNVSTITMTSSAASDFVALMSSKLQPLWTKRTNLIVQDGVGIEVPSATHNREFVTENGSDEGTWTLRIGEVVSISGPGRSNAAAGVYRGLIVELSYDLDDGLNEEDVSEEDVRARAEGFREVLDDIFDTEQEIFGNLRFHAIKDESKGADWEQRCAELYMNVFRGAR